MPFSAPHASILSVRKLFDLGRFEPARAQRDYQWGERQWAHLLSDLVNAFRASGLDPEPQVDDTHVADHDGADADTATVEPVAPASPTKALTRAAKLPHYYLGHVLLLPRQAGDQFLIYDGQQRLTTLTLLLCALRDAAGAESWYSIQEVIRTPPPGNHPRMTVNTRGAALARIIDALGGTRPQTIPNASAPIDHQIYNGAAFLLGRIEGWSQSRREAFAAFVLDRVFLTVTTMQDRRVAEYAYITINTRGKPLENKDIIKGHFVQLASRRSLGAANDISAAWAKLERQAGKRLDHLLRMAFLLDYREPPTFDFGAQLMDYFEDEAKLDEVTAWLTNRLPEIVDHFQTYVLAPQRQMILGATQASLRRLVFLPWKQWQAMVFHFVRRDRNAPKRFAASVRALERWCFSINLLDVDDDWLSGAFIRALAQPDPFGKGGELRLSKSWRLRVGARLSDGQITDSERRGAHVRWLETLQWPDDQVDFSATNDTSVEHVLPQRATGQWLEDFSKAPLIYSEKFGNLCLLPKALNKQLENWQYADKRPHFLRLEPHFKSAHDVARSQKWTAHEVEERTRRLCEQAIKSLAL